MAVIYSSRMESLAFFEVLTGTVTLIPGWGIDRLNALTCSRGSTARLAAATYLTELHEGTIRWQYGYLYVSGEDFSRNLAEFNCKDGVAGRSSNRSFLSVLQLNVDGSLTFYRANSPTGGTLVIGTSAPGVFVRDGRIHALQFRFSFPTHASITYEFLVNNVSVLAGTHTTTQSFECLGGLVGGVFYPTSTKHYWLRYAAGTDPVSCHLQIERTGINHVGFLHHAKIGVGAFTDHISSLVEVVIDDAAAPVSYLPGNAAAIKMNACSGELPPVTTPPRPPACPVTFPIG